MQHIPDLHGRMLLIAVLNLPETFGLLVLNDYFLKESDLLSIIDSKGNITNMHKSRRITD